MSNLTTQVNEQTIFTKKDGTSFNLDELKLRELGDLMFDDDFEKHVKLIVNVYNKKLAENAYLYLKSQGIEL